MVTDANKENYVELLVEYKIKKGIEEQIENFLEGFHELIPLNWVAIFTPNELELLISGSTSSFHKLTNLGLPTIDIDDWKKNTAYTGFTEDSTQVKWFWQWVESLSVPDKGIVFVQLQLKQLQRCYCNLRAEAVACPSEDFPTFKASKDPANSLFSSQRKMLHSYPPPLHGKLCRLYFLPRSYNIIKLPEYESYDKLAKMCYTAISHGHSGFTFN